MKKNNSTASRFPFAHTFSIVARDPQSNQIGVAVQSHWFSVGPLVPWAEAGVGAVATQAMVEPSYGPLGLQEMRLGKTASQALGALLALDPNSQIRQIAMIDASGSTAAHTGERCIAAAGHITGDNFSVQANMMLKDTVWSAMAAAFRESRGELSDRLLTALDGAQAEGGDIRGKQSAAIIIVEGTRQENPWEGRILDLRVEDHPEPLAELRRLVNIQKAYQWMNMGDERLGKGLTEEAFQAYQTAANLAPQILELPFWNAVTLLDLGREAEALQIFQPIFQQAPSWRELLRRLPAAGMLKVDDSVLQGIIAS